MAWFQRYGFPGAFFWGFLLLWLAGIYYCELCRFLTGDLAKTVGAVAAASFLPIGYLVSIVQQLIYVWCKKPRFGITGPAIEESGVFYDTDEREYLLEAEACLVVTSDKVHRREDNMVCEVNMKLNMDKLRFLQDWIRNRNNVMAINLSSIVAGILAFLTASLFPWLCLEWEVQVNPGWLIFAVVVNIFVLLILFLSWILLRREVIRAEVGLYKMLAGLPASNLKMKNDGHKGECQDQG